MSEWQEVLKKELRRRRQLFELNKKKFNELHAQNPKGLKEDCFDHVWVPATHLMIQCTTDKLIRGLFVRSFKEARPFKSDEDTIVPQICWKCSSTREHTIGSTAHGLYARPRRRKKCQHIEDNFTELLEHALDAL